MSADDLVSWKADLLAKGRAAKTIRDSKLAPVRAIFQWAVDNRKLDTNPAARINIDLKSRSSEKRRRDTDDEAKIILRTARIAKETHKRRVPWVCAYTGARIAEICQLRFEDIRQIEGIWCIAFAAEAGSLRLASDLQSSVFSLGLGLDLNSVVKALQLRLQPKPLARLPPEKEAFPTIAA